MDERTKRKLRDSCDKAVKQVNDGIMLEDDERDYFLQYLGEAIIRLKDVKR